MNVCVCVCVCVCMCVCVCARVRVKRNEPDSWRNEECIWFSSSPAHCHRLVCLVPSYIGSNVSCALFSSAFIVFCRQLLRPQRAAPEDSQDHLFPPPYLLDKVGQHLV